MKKQFRMAACYCTVLFTLLCCFGLQAQQQVTETKYYGGEPILLEQEQDFSQWQHLFSGTVTPTKRQQNDTDYSTRSANCPTQGINRTIDGSCNNISINVAADFGKANIQLRRELPSVYNSNGDPVGTNRGNPRVISNTIFKDECGASSKRLSSFVFSWGQFLDHDLSATPTNSAEPFPISIPPNDDFTGIINFNRSRNEGGPGALRQQGNDITSWIDASNVYGSDVITAGNLRSNVNGKLKVITSSPHGDLLPTGSGMLPPGGGFFMAGDGRVNEQPGLTALHTLFVREHNRICDQLVAAGMTVDEDIYQAARKEVGAIIQSITYNEFLPALGVSLSAYSGYDDSVQPDIFNSFAAAAFRLGHTMVSDNVPRFDDNGNSIGHYTLEQSFFRPELIANNGIEDILNGLARQFQEEIDAKIVENLRTVIGQFPGAPNFDLAAINIQRGRDHGLADYNTFRTHFTANPANTYSDISSDPEVQIALQTAYPDIDDMDLWVGLLAEDHVPGTSLGLTLHAMLAEQFERLRDGDFYYYENDPAFTAADVFTIKNTRLSDVIKRNTNIVNIKNQVFFAPCPVTTNLGPTDNILGTAREQHKASFSLTASNDIGNTAGAVYDAAFEVTLLPGFDSVMGSELHALINGCDSGGFNKQAEQALLSLQSETVKVSNFPNPFSDITTIKCDLAEAAKMHLSVMNMAGQELVTVLSGTELSAGHHQFDFDGSKLTPGIYLLLIQTARGTQTQKMVIAR